MKIQQHPTTTADVFFDALDILSLLPLLMAFGLFVAAVIVLTAAIL